MKKPLHSGFGATILCVEPGHEALDVEVWIQKTNTGHPAKVAPDAAFGGIRLQSPCPASPALVGLASNMRKAPDRPAVQHNDKILRRLIHADCHWLALPVPAAAGPDRG